MSDCKECGYGPCMVLNEDGVCKPCVDRQKSREYERRKQAILAATHGYTPECVAAALECNPIPRGEQSEMRKNLEQIEVLSDHVRQRIIELRCLYGTYSISSRIDELRNNAEEDLAVAINRLVKEAKELKILTARTSNA